MALRVIEVVLELTELLAPAGLSRHYALRHQPYPPVVQAEEQLLRFVAYLALPDDGGGDAPASSSPPPLPSLRAQMLEEVLRWCEAAFLSCVRSILTEIYLCHACSCHEILSGNAAAGRTTWCARWASGTTSLPHRPAQRRRCRLRRTSQTGSSRRSLRSWRRICP